MDYALIRRLLREKLRDRGTYTLAFVVGTLINAYGHLLVPWFRTDADPFALFLKEFMERPGLTVFSITIAYVFPFCVGTYSVVTARYRNRRMESIADFPERKPDPVFRVTREGDVIEAGAVTRELFERHDITRAQQIIGADTWASLTCPDDPAEDVSVYFSPEQARYLVRCEATTENCINVYMTLLPKR